MDFVCHRGEIVGIIGPNGTGKSTFGRIFAGLLKENSGEVFLFGHKTRPRERMGKVWYIPQDLDSQLFGEDLVDELTTGAPTDEKRNARAGQFSKPWNWRSMPSSTRPPYPVGRNNDWLWG